MGQESHLVLCQYVHVERVLQIKIALYLDNANLCNSCFVIFSDFLKRPLESYVKKLKVPVHVIRMEQRSGLIRARLKGAAVSKGQVITFLDAHCECTAGWLEPLLARIKHDR